MKGISLRQGLTQHINTFIKHFTMANLKLFIFAAILAYAYATTKEEEQRVKKDVLLGTIPYAYQALPYAYAAYDDGKYYPGKYEKAVFAPAVTAYHSPAVVSAYSAAAAVPVSYAALPTYPYAKTYVY